MQEGEVQVINYFSFRLLQSIHRRSSNIVSFCRKQERLAQQKVTNTASDSSIKSEGKSTGNTTPKDIKPGSPISTVSTTPNSSASSHHSNGDIKPLNGSYFTPVLLRILFADSINCFKRTRKQQQRLKISRRIRSMRKMIKTDSSTKFVVRPHNTYISKICLFLAGMNKLARCKLRTRSTMQKYVIRFISSSSCVVSSNISVMLYRGLFCFPYTMVRIFCSTNLQFVFRKKTTEDALIVRLFSLLFAVLTVCSFAIPCPKNKYKSLDGDTV